MITLNGEYIIIVKDETFYMIDTKTSNDEIEVFGIEKLMSLYNCIFITCQIDLLLRYDILNNNHILDFECVDKQIRQSIGKDTYENNSWSVSNMVSTYLSDEIISKSDYDNEKKLLILLKRCYSFMKSQCPYEFRRIYKIELPINKLLYKQLGLISFDNNNLVETISDMHNEIYQLKNIIQTEMGIVSPNYELYARKYNIDLSKLPKDIKSISYRNPNFDIFYQLQKKENTFNALMHLPLNYNQINPIIKGFGSTTGRIILREPALQNLNKDLRHLLCPKINGKKYIYIDYSQFEAGILAGISGNEKLIDLYQKGLIYDTLAQMLSVEREHAKTIFYMYVYGAYISKGAEGFFNNYGIDVDVKKLLEEETRKGYSESPLGNRRITKTDDANKWILNHKIQSTASLIFKKALLNADAKFGEDIKLIIPMHDAGLYLVDNNFDSKELINEYKNAFREFVPAIENPICKEKNFYE